MMCTTTEIVTIILWLGDFMVPLQFAKNKTGFAMAPAVIVIDYYQYTCSQTYITSGLSVVLVLYRAGLRGQGRHQAARQFLADLHPEMSF